MVDDDDVVVVVVVVVVVIVVVDVDVDDDDVSVAVVICFVYGDLCICSYIFYARMLTEGTWTKHHETIIFCFLDSWEGRPSFEAAVSVDAGVSWTASRKNPSCKTTGTTTTAWKNLDQNQQKHCINTAQTEHEKSMNPA